MALVDVEDVVAVVDASVEDAVVDRRAGPGLTAMRSPRANETAFGRLALLPRVLRGAEKPELDVTLLGSRASMPVLVAPTAFHRLADTGGERATARAAATAETIMMVSMASTVAAGDVAAAAPGARLWFQLYVQPDMAFTETLVRRAEAAGCGRSSCPRSSLGSTLPGFAR